MKVRDLLLRGMSRKEIAHKLGVSLSSVDAHATQIYKRLNIHSIGQLANHYGTKLATGAALKRINQQLDRIEKALRKLL